MTETFMRMRCGGGSVGKAESGRQERG